MGRNKLERYAQNAESPLIVEEGKDFYHQSKGKWNDFFGNDNPIVLELACGRGEYSVGLAEIYPNINFIGVDIKGARLWKGSNIAKEKDLHNVAFLRTYIQNIVDFFEEGEVKDIWVIHPDPRPKKKDAKRRLTHPRFLEMYRQLIGTEGFVHFKTDNPGLFEYTLTILETQAIRNLAYTRDLYTSPLYKDHHGIKTKYEIAFEAKGFKINYLKFQFGMKE